MLCSAQAAEANADLELEKEKSRKQAERLVEMELELEKQKEVLRRYVGRFKTEEMGVRCDCEQPLPLFSHFGTLQLLFGGEADCTRAGQVDTLRRERLPSNLLNLI